MWVYPIQIYVLLCNENVTTVIRNKITWPMCEVCVGCIWHLKYILLIQKLEFHKILLIFDRVILGVACILKKAISSLGLKIVMPGKTNTTFSSPFFFLMGMRIFGLNWTIISTELQHRGWQFTAKYIHYHREKLMDKSLIMGERITVEASYQAIDHKLLFWVDYVL